MSYYIYIEGYIKEKLYNSEQCVLNNYISIASLGNHGGGQDFMTPSRKSFSIISSIFCLALLENALWFSSFMSFLGKEFE